MEENDMVNGGNHFREESDTMKVVEENVIK
jgi:hypothetical protein